MESETDFACEGEILNDFADGFEVGFSCSCDASGEFGVGVGYICTNWNYL